MEPITLISGALMALIGAFSAYSSYKSQQTANDTNIKLQNLANQANETNINKMNDYNSPVSQVARLSAAGLNPNLVYGNGQLTNVQSSSAQNVAPHVSPAGLDLSNLSGSISSTMDNFIKLRQAGIAQDANNINRLNANTNAKNAETNAKNANSNAKNANSNAKNAETNANKANADILYKQALTTNAQIMSESLRSQITGLNLDNESKSIMLQNLPTLIRLGNVEKLANIRLTNSNVDVNGHKINLSDAQLSQINAITQQTIKNINEIMPLQEMKLSSEIGLINSNINLNAERSKQISTEIKLANEKISNIMANTALTKQQTENISKQNSVFWWDWFFNKGVAINKMVINMAKLGSSVL